MLITKVLCVLLIISLCENVSCRSDPRHVAQRKAKERANEDDEEIGNIDKLRKHLFTEYDKHARPVAHHSISTNTTIGIAITHVDVVELRSVFTVHGWIRLSWHDDRLIWDPNDYGNLSVIRLPDHQVWQPDIALYNSAEGSNIDHFGNTRALVYNNGKVLWVPPADLHAFCELNLRHWPYDEQTCTLKFGSWTYDGYSLNLTISDRNTHEDIVENIIVTKGEWEVLLVTAKRSAKYYDCCTEPYLDVTYNVTIKRRSSLYSTALIVPAFMVAILTQILFWLPPYAGEKILIGGVSTLMSSLMLLFLSNKLPSLSDNTPIIVVIYGWSLALSVIAIVISVFTIRLSRLPMSRNVPHWLSIVFNSCVGKVLGLNAGYNLAARKHTPLPELDMREADVNNLHIQEQAASSDWVPVAMAIDRIAFLIYSIVFGILFMLLM